MEQIVWHVTAFATSTGLAPLLRAAIACLVLYQIDLSLVIGAWLLRKVGVLRERVALEPENRLSAVVVLPTLLRTSAELDGLMVAMRSVAHNGYPGPLFVVACIDGHQDRPDLFRSLLEWTGRQRVAPGVHLHAVGTPRRRGKAVAMDVGVEHIKRLVQERRIARFPDLFFNMDADSTLGERVLERMAYRLTRRRLLRGTPFHIVTSNVIVPLEQCFSGWSSLLRPRCWLALLVAREYLSSISLGKYNWKIFPRSEVSGALYCTWSAVYLAAPYYARFMQTLTWRDWLKWWVGCPPPRFSAFRGRPLPEAMTGPGDDTWMGWLAATATWKNGRLSFDAPRTPLHALGRMVMSYFARALTYDPLIKVYSKTPTTARALFKQRLRWNSSRVQDLKRWFRSHAYHWNVGLPLLLSTAVVVISISLFAATLLAVVAGIDLPPSTWPLAILAGAGYFATRVTSTVAALLISDSPRSEWIKLLALPFSGLYHVCFNTLTLLIGYFRDIFGFGEPTTFAPEETLRASNLSRVALAYRLRRAFFLSVRAARYGDVPLGRFWFGWKQTPWTPSGFDGWTTGRRPPAIHPSPRATGKRGSAPEQTP